MDDLSAAACAVEGPGGFLCSREPGHHGDHIAQGDGNRVFASWPQYFVDTQAEFPHICPGDGCALCRYVRVRTVKINGAAAV